MLLWAKGNNSTSLIYLQKPSLGGVIRTKPGVLISNPSHQLSWKLQSIKMGACIIKKLCPRKWWSRKAHFQHLSSNGGLSQAKWQWCLQRTLVTRWSHSLSALWGLLATGFYYYSDQEGRAWEFSEKQDISAAFNSKLAEKLFKKVSREEKKKCKKNVKEKKKCKKEKSTRIEIMSLGVFRMGSRAEELLTKLGGWRERGKQLFF